MRKASSVSFLRKKWMWLCKVAPSALSFLAVVFVVLGVTLHVRLHGNAVQERGLSIPALFSEQITDLTANLECITSEYVTGLPTGLGFKDLMWETLNLGTERRVRAATLCLTSRLSLFRGRGEAQSRESTADTRHIVP